MAVEDDRPQDSSLSKPEIAIDLLQMASEMALAISLDGKEILYANPSASRMLRLDRRSESPLDWLAKVHPDDRDELHNNLASIANTRSFIQEFRLMRNEADEVWVKGRFQLILSYDGAPKFIGVTSRDVTRRIDAERQLEESQAIYRTLVESLPINVFRKDLDGRIVFANQRYCDELKLTLSQLIGKTDFDLFPAMAEKYRRDDLWVLDTGMPFHDIESHPRGSGDVMYVEVLKAPVSDATGRRIGIQGMFWDVTTRKKAEQALLLAKEAAEAHSRSKSDFLANISHEIRTPLNGIIGITDLLLGSVREREQREYLELIQNSSDSLLNLINEILDFSKIESGKIQLQSKRFSLRDSIGDTIRSLAVRAHTKGLELCMTIAPQVPDQIVGDLDRLRQILVNLVGNAIKFTHEGEVDFQVQQVLTQNHRTTLQFSVRDTGIGIPEEKFAAIFREFEQVDTSSTRKYGGTGLGLAIAAKLVELMGGTLQVESQLGQGSRFWFTADFHFHDDLPNTFAKTFNHQRVLLIAPHLGQRKSLASVLSAAHLDCLSCDSLEQGWQQLSDSKSAGTTVDVIVCDADLNQQTIVRFFGQLHRAFGSRKIPVLLLTRFIANPLIAELLKPGLVDEVLIKPIKELEFLTSIGWATGCIDKNNDVNHSTTASNVGLTRPLQVLVVEDNIVNQKLAVGLLKKGGHRSVVAKHGQDAVDRYGEQPFDLVLLDIQMPVMDGYEACKRIRHIQSQTGIFVPIIALTAHASQEDRARCLEAGMDEYLAKPIRPEALFGMIEKLTGHSSKISQPDSESESFAHAVDWQHAFETVGGDRQLLIELIQVFNKDQPKMLGTIESAIDKSDPKELRIAAHALKGALTHLGGKEPARLAMVLENLAKNGELATAPELFKELQKSLQEVLREMERFASSNS
jgi:PAS domain S-box-containing protein